MRRFFLRTLRNITMVILPTVILHDRSSAKRSTEANPGHIDRALYFF